MVQCYLGTWIISAHQSLKYGVTNGPSVKMEREIMRKFGAGCARVGFFGWNLSESLDSKVYTLRDFRDNII